MDSVVLSTSVSPVDTGSLKSLRVGFLLSVPFRFRLGTLFRCGFKMGSEPFEIIIRNPVDIPAGVDALDDRMVQTPMFAKDSIVLVVAMRPRIRKEKQAEILAYAGSDDIRPKILPYEVRDDALRALNRFIVSYATAMNTLFGGGPLRLLNSDAFITRTEWDILFWGSDSLRLESDLVVRALNRAVPRDPWSRSRNWGHLDDYPIDEAQRKIARVLAEPQNHLFYQLVLEAKTKRIFGQYREALLDAVAGLEGVHALLVQSWFKRIGAKNGKEISENFLLNVGMKLCNEISPYLFLSESERPSNEQIAETRRAIKFRNEIMHALTNKRGEVKHFMRSNDDLSGAINAVLGMYGVYLKALRERQNADFAMPSAHRKSRNLSSQLSPLLSRGGRGRCRASRRGGRRGWGRGCRR